MLHTERFHVLDSFRGLCALSVVLYHLHVPQSLTELVFFRNAELFVDFFFVLSGFVLAHGYGTKHNIDLKKFLISRTFRIFPLHIAMLLVFILLELAKLLAYRNGVSFGEAPFTENRAVSEILPNLLLVQAWTDATNKLSFNYPSWSISIEYYMYLFFAALTLCGTRPRYIAWTIISASMFLALYAGSEIFTEAAMRGLSSFFAGALAYLVFVFVKNNAPPGRALTMALEPLLLVAACWLVTADIDHKSILTSLVFCCITVIFAFEQGRISGLLTTPLLTTLGKLSYSIYMTHIAVIFCVIAFSIVLQKLLGKEFSYMVGDARYLDFGNLVLNNLLVFAVLAAVILCSTFTYKYIEATGQDIGKRILKARPSPERNLAL